MDEPNWKCAEKCTERLLCPLAHKYMHMRTHKKKC